MRVPDLETLIREFAGRGEITHISLSPRGKGWAASYSPASVFGVSFAEHADPVEALKEAMTNIKLRRKSPKATKPTKEPDPEAPALEDDGLPDPTA